MLGLIGSTVWKSGLLYYFNYPLIKKFLKFKRFSGLSGNKLIVPAGFQFMSKMPEQLVILINRLR